MSITGKQGVQLWLWRGCPYLAELAGERAMGKPLLGFLTGMLSGLLLGTWGVSSHYSAFEVLQSGAREEAVYDGLPTSFWIDQLQDRDPAFRQQAVQALEHIGPAEKGVVTALAGMLKDRSVGVRLGTALALGRFGPTAKAAVPELLLCVRDADRFVRSHAIRALGAIDSSSEVVAALTSALEDEDPAVRRAAVETLGTLGS
jgi:HEAT repeat protein